MVTDAAVTPRPDALSSPEDPLDPRTTAILITAADAVTIAVATTAIYLHVDSVGGMLEFPLNLALVAVVVLVVRLIALQALAQGWKAIVRGLRDVYDRLADVTFQSIIGRPKKPQAVRPLPPRLITDVSRVQAHRTTWYVLLGLGMFAQLLLVGATGGLVESPFTEILVATFVLGQFRSPTGKATWSLFGIGVLCAILAHVLFLGLSYLRRDAMEAQHWGTVAHLAPLLMVGLMSTVVSFFLRKSEDERTEPEIGDPAFAQVAEPGVREAPGPFTVVTQPVTESAAGTNIAAMLVAGSTAQRKTKEGTTKPTPPVHAVWPTEPHVSLCGMGVVSFPDVPFPAAKTAGEEPCSRCRSLVDALPDV